ncbi:hypothetical protein LTR56_015891 [Elasticomyces elasticus]|nr:hypothetical protein LTR56_015891 [Elasticomyces elasticus]KAK3640053.1 hypothetical protein LTR22_017211 [Elasticomyces elasticus]KAK4905394.1 hypothetical protein LTR49_025299 [Elasticomyces elasticus]KAK5755008.1 hypothetical protein LTS12_014924 [Elasticomyces elasticus]
MADDNQHFRLLDLPPELRVRIYECFFEVPNSIEATDIFEAQQHAPNLAIAATSRLIRREALAIGKAAMLQFYQQGDLFIQMSVCSSVQWREEMQNLQAAASALPSFPLSTFELRYSIQRSSGEKNDCRMTASIAAGGNVEGHTRWFNNGVEYQNIANRIDLEKGARRKDITLTWGTRLQYLHVVNVLRALGKTVYRS